MDKAWIPRLSQYFINAKGAVDKLLIDLGYPGLFGLNPKSDNFEQICPWILSG